MLQIKNQPLTSISNRLYFCAIRNNISNISRENFKIIHQPFVVKKEFCCYNESVKCNFTVTTLNYFI
jgi:hypothetical protein